jgi:hypothetical protein
MASPVELRKYPSLGEPTPFFSTTAQLAFHGTATQDLFVEVDLVPMAKVIAEHQSWGWVEATVHVASFALQPDRTSFVTISPENAVITNVGSHRDIVPGPRLVIHFKMPEDLTTAKTEPLTFYFKCPSGTRPYHREISRK